MNAPVIYLIDPQTAAFVGTSYADADPLAPGSWLIPAHAYLDAPPAVTAGFAAVRLDDGWGQVPDHRGTVYSTETGQPSEHTQLGELPEGLTSHPRPSADHIWSG